MHAVTDLLEEKLLRFAEIASEVAALQGTKLTAVRPRCARLPCLAGSGACPYPLGVHSACPTYWQKITVTTTTTAGRMERWGT